MCVCVCVCVYAYVCMCMYVVSTFVYMCICKYMCISIPVCMCMCIVCVCTCVRACVRKNGQAPIMVKLKVVQACINSSLTYACETWGSSALNKVEVLQRKALKIAMNIKQNTANQIIVYIEVGLNP